MKAQSSVWDLMALGGSFGCPPLVLRPSVIAAARGMPPSLPMRPGVSGPLSLELPLPICVKQNRVAIAVYSPVIRLAECKKESMVVT